MSIPVVLVISGSGTVSLTRVADPDLGVLVIYGYRNVFLTIVSDPDPGVLVVSGSKTVFLIRTDPIFCRVGSSLNKQI